MADFGDYAGQYLTIARDAPRTAAALMSTDAELQRQALERKGINTQNQVAEAQAPYAGPMAAANLAGAQAQSQVAQAQAPFAGQMAQAKLTGSPFEQQKFAEDKRAERVKEAISAYNADPLGMHPELHPNANPGGLPPGSAMPQVAKGQPGAVGMDFLQSLPIPMQQQVKAIADGKMAPPSGFALKTPYWQSMMAAVGQYDPSFDMTNWQARQKTVSDFTSGKSFQNLNAINTAIGHLGTLSDAADALKNGNLPVVNSVTNTIANQFGKPAVKNFDMAKNAVGDELMRVFRQVGASVTEAENWKKTIGSSGSPEQLHGAIKMAATLLDSRIDSLNQGFKQGFGKPADTLAMVYPKSRQVLEALKVSGKPEGQSNVPPQAIQMLKSNPALKDAFEEKYGKGSASAVLGQ